MSVVPTAGEDRVPAGRRRSSVAFEKAVRDDATLQGVSDDEAAAGDENVDWSQRPIPAGGGPTKVEFVLYFAKWEVVAADGHEYLTVRCGIDFYWCDPRMKGYAVARGVPDDLWRPEVMGCPGCSLGAAEAGKQLPKFYGISASVKVSPDGKMQLNTTIALDEKSPGYTLSDDLERMRLFPFDSTRVDLSIMIAGKKRTITEDVELSMRRPNIERAVERGLGPYQQLDWKGVRHSGDYTLETISLAIGSHQPPSWYKQPHHPEDIRVRDIMLSLHLHRTPTFYVQKGIEPMYGAGLFSFLTFLTDPYDLGTRLSVLASLFLTCYAIQWVTIERLPRLPFATVLDEATKNTVLAIFAMATAQSVCFQLAKRSRAALDAVAAGRTGEEAFDSAVAEQCDAISGGAVALFLFVYSILYRTVWCVRAASQRGGANQKWTDGGHIRNRVMRPLEAWRFHAEKFTAEKAFLGTGEQVKTLAHF